MAKILIDNQNIDQISEPFESLGGIAVVTILADDFGTAKVTLQMTTVNSQVVSNPWVNLDNGVFTDPSIVKLDYLPAGTLVRAELSSADGSTTNVFVDILQ